MFILLRGNVQSQSLMPISDFCVASLPTSDNFIIHKMIVTSNQITSPETFCGYPERECCLSYGGDSGVVLDLHLIL